MDTSFEFEAEDPTTHTFDVQIEMPAGTDLEITFVTTDDTMLYIFDPSRTEAWCDEATVVVSFAVSDSGSPRPWDLDRVRPQTVDLSGRREPIEQNR